MKKKAFFLLCLCLFLQWNGMHLYAHPGRTDKYGGHTDRSTGQYHYHNPDGTITVAPAPPKSSSSSSKKTESSSGETSAQSQTNQTDSSQQQNVSSENTVVVSGTVKPLQEGAASEEPDKSPDKNTQTGETPSDPSVQTSQSTTNKSGKNYITVSYTPPLVQFYHQVVYFILFLAAIGFCILSTLFCKFFKKIEQKGNAWRIILHVPYILFLLPAFIGKYFFKWYNALTKEKA